jgi:hypothetical protein
VGVYRLHVECFPIGPDLITNMTGHDSLPSCASLRSSLQPRYRTLEGSKVWEMYESYVRLPDKDQQWVLSGNEDLELPSDVVTLNAGDVLYVPRGLTHRVVSPPDSASFHLTVGLEAPSRLGRTMQC